MLALLAGACHNGSPTETILGPLDPIRAGPCREPGPTPLPVSPFAVAVTIPDSAVVGAPLTFAITVRNTTGQPATLLTGLADQTFNFIVRGPDGAMRWNRLVAYNGGFVEDVAVTRTLAPGAEIRYAATWDQRDLNGRAVVAGRYDAFGVLFSGLSDGQPGGCYRSGVHPLLLLP